MVCLSDALITVPQGVLGTIAANTSTMALPLFGLAGVLLAHGARKIAKSADVKGALAEATESQLRADAQNVVYPLAELVSISFKRPMLGSPEVRLERRGQNVMVFGVTAAGDFGDICGELKRMYPTLCRDAA
jgi:hypothetical protein